MSPEAQFFLDNLTSEDAYWVGYLRADGGVYQPQPDKATVLAFSQVHYEPVRQFADYIGKNVREVQVKSSIYSGSKPVRYEVRGSCKLAAVYRELGVKTEFLSPIFLSNPHFWRGMVDGDGTLIAKPYPVVQLVGTELDMERFAHYISVVAGGKPTRVTTHGTIYRTRVSCNRATYLVKALYGSGPSWLAYKRAIAESILSLTPSDHFNAARAVTT